MIIADLARGVTQAGIDFVHYPITYCVAPNNDAASIAAWTAVLSRYAYGITMSKRPARVRLAGAPLDAGLDGLAEPFARHVMGLGTTQ